MSDPYVAVFVDYMEECRTAVRSDTLDPVWNETFLIALTSIEDLHLQVFDEDPNRVRRVVRGGVGHVH